MAVSSKIDICNLALDHLGKPSIMALDEGSVEAQYCNRLYDVARRAALAAQPWTFARKLRYMSLLVSNPLSDIWAYHYDIPNDCLKLRQVVEEGTRVDENTPPAPRYIENGTLYSNIPNALIYYTLDSTEVSAWSTMFDEAVALGLAFRMAPGMTRRKADVKELRDSYVDMMGEAAMHDAQQENTTYTFYDGGYVDARDTGDPSYGSQADGSTIWD